MNNDIFIHTTINLTCYVHITTCMKCFVVWQGSHRSGKIQEKVKILKSQEKVRKFFMGQEILKFIKKFRKKSENWSWYQYEGLIPNIDCQYHKVVAQSCSRRQEIQENKIKTYFYRIWTFCKSSQNLVSMAHKNDKSYLSIYRQSITAIFFLHLCDPYEFLWRSNIIFSCCLKSVQIGTWSGKSR